MRFCRRISLPSFIPISVIAIAASLFPITSTFAYWQYYADDAGGNGANFQYQDSPNNRWSFQLNESNGYDNDTAIDCLEEYSGCKSSGTSDWATWTPGNTRLWWLCPKTHIAKQSNWSSNDARYTSHTSSGAIWQDMHQPYFLDNWYPAPNADYSPGDYLHLNNMGNGGGSISADMTTFHYNPNNSTDTSCS